MRSRRSPLPILPEPALLPESGASRGESASWSEATPDMTEGAEAAEPPEPAYRSRGSTSEEECAAVMRGAPERVGGEGKAKGKGEWG